MISHATALKAAKALALKLDGLQADQITGAFRKLSKDCHPDGETNNPVMWQSIVWARQTLAAWLAQRIDGSTQPTAAAPGACRACKGTGRVEHRTGHHVLTKACVLCGGSGNAQTHDRNQ